MLFICFPLFIRCGKPHRHAPRLFGGAHAGVRHKRFPAEINRFQYYPPPHRPLCGDTHRRDNLCAWIHTAEHDARRWTQRSPQASALRRSPVNPGGQVQLFDRLVLPDPLVVRKRKPDPFRLARYMAASAATNQSIGAFSVHTLSASPRKSAQRSYGRIRSATARPPGCSSSSSTDR